MRTKDFMILNEVVQSGENAHLEDIVPRMEAQSKDLALRKLIVVSVVCVMFMLAEIVGGVLSNSLAIFTDAAHMLSDLSSFMVSAVSVILASKKANSKLTWGFHRAEIVGAILSINIIWGLTAWLVLEAVNRIINPEEVDSTIMIIIACVGIFCNIIMAKLLHSHPHSHGSENHTHENDSENGPQHEHEHHHHHHHHHNMNLRAALIHVLGDFIQSIGVLIAAIVIHFKPNWVIIDPLLTFVFSIVVLFTTIPIIKDCIDIIMQKVPSHINIDQLREDLNQIQEVVSVHDLHVWNVTADRVTLSCHIVADDAECALTKATEVCREKYNIPHLTLQVEKKNNDFFCLNYHE